MRLRKSRAAKCAASGVPARRQGLERDSVVALGPVADGSVR